MPEIDPATLAEMTTEVVTAYVAKNSVPLAEMPTLIASVHGAFGGLGKAAATDTPTSKPTPPVSIKKSITDEYLISLEDGKRYQSLKRHLTKHGLTPAEYRAKWDLPNDYPMVTAAYAAKRSTLAKSQRLGSQRRKK